MAKLIPHLARARAKKGPTRLEIACRTLLTELGVEFEEQKPIGNHTVDFYVPRIKLVIEADGAHWHQSEAKEQSRDSYLRRNALVADVLHLTEKQLAPWLPATSSSQSRRSPTAAISTSA